MRNMSLIANLATAALLSVAPGAAPFMDVIRDEPNHGRSPRNVRTQTKITGTGDGAYRARERLSLIERANDKARQSWPVSSESRQVRRAHERQYLKRLR